MVARPAIFCQVMSDKVEGMVSPSVDLEPWERVWREHRVAWKSMVKMFLAHVASAPPVSRPSRSEAGFQPVPRSWPCDECTSVFASSKAMWSHKMAKHGHRNKYRLFVVGVVCPSCQVSFGTRARVIDHIAHRCKKCKLVADSGSLPQVPEAILQVLDAETQAARVSARKRGESHLLAPRPSAPASLLVGAPAVGLH